MAKENKQGKQGLAARRAAVDLISGVLDDELLMSFMLEATYGPLVVLSPEDKARGQRLALTTLRNVERADRILKPHLRKKPMPRVHHILRLAVIEMCVDGASAHGVVDAAVSLAREDRDTASMAALVNAVLRKVAVDGPGKWPSLDAPRLQGWLRGRLQPVYGGSTVAKMEKVHAAMPPVDLTPKNGDAAALAAALGGEVVAGGSVRLTQPGRISGLAGYEAGDWWVQDAAAALPVQLLGVKPGEQALDMCAAPGGKTMQMAAAGAKVTALDLSGARLKRVHENLERCGLSAKVVKGDACHWQGGPFDAILLDAPCSATGTIRRHPDLPFVKSSANIKELVALQAEMLDHAVTLLKPGGRLVFCTCSLLPEEGEDQIEAALARHSDLQPDSEAALPDGLPEGLASGPGFRLRPDQLAGGWDGFYMAALRKV